MWGGGGGGISGRVRALNLTVPLGSGRVGSDDLGYGPGSGFSFEPVQTSTVHTGIKGRQVHPLIRFLLQSRADEKSADLHKAVHLCFVPGWRNGVISGVPLISDSPVHFN